MYMFCFLQLHLMCLTYFRLFDSLQARIVAMTCTHAAMTRGRLVELGFKYDRYSTRFLWRFVFVNLHFLTSTSRFESFAAL